MFRITLLIFAACVLLPKQAAAGSFEFSLGFSFSRSNYSDTSYSWSRRWGASIGYHFWEHSELEIAFQDVTDRTQIQGFEDTTFHDQIYSLNWVQSLHPKDFPVQPYVKLGVGQLNRDAQGTYANGLSPPVQMDSLTVVLGAGLRIFIARTFALRAEGTSYLTGGNINTYQDNFAFTVGGSLFF